MRAGLKKPFQPVWQMDPGNSLASGRFLLKSRPLFHEAPQMRAFDLSDGQ